MSTIPTSAFCERASSDGMTEAKFDAVKDLETRLRAEFELSREKNRAANRVEFEKSRAANRVEFEKSREKNRVEFEKSRADNRARISELEKSRADNRARVSELEKSRGDNRKRIATLEKDTMKMKKASKKNRETINGFIYLTRLRENVRMAELFFNELYKKWVFASAKFGGKVPKYSTGWKHNLQLRQDYDRYPNPGSTFSSREERLAAPGVDRSAREEAVYRRTRAKAFLREAWVNFGDSKKTTLATWLRLVKFVENTNSACHASPSFGGVERASNVVAAQRLVRPEVKIESTEQLMTDLLFMIDTLGRNSWTHDSAWKFAMENKTLFPNWPAA